MVIAVTVHAVKRYQERVPGAENLEEESVRGLIRQLVEEGFKHGNVEDHPTERQKRIIPFKAGDEILYFSIGPNKHKNEHPGDLTVVGVLYEKELGGKVGTGVTLGDVLPQLKEMAPAPKRPPKYRVVIGDWDSVETYSPQDEKELRELLQRRQPRADEVLIYELQEVQIQVKYEIGRKASSK